MNGPGRGTNGDRPLWSRRADQRGLSPLVPLWLIRHGTVKGNLEKRFVGITDEPLTEEGAALIREKAATGRYPEPDVVFSSPLRRCVETARILFPAAEPILVPEWSEILFGDFEYGNYIELSGDPRYQAWIDSGGEAAFPGGESRAAYTERVIRGFHKVCGILRERQTAERPLTAAAAVHLGTMKALLSALTGAGYFDIQAGNGGGHLLTVDVREEKILSAEEFS